MTVRLPSRRASARCSACRGPCSSCRRRTASTTSSPTSTRRCCRCSFRGSACRSPRPARSRRPSRSPDRSRSSSSGRSPTAGGRRCWPSPGRSSPSRCMSLAGLATSPLMLGAILVVGSLGSAAFHPTAAAIVNRVGGARRGTSMSVHVTGGAMGNAIAPMLFAPYAQYVGLSWTPLLAVPALVLLRVDPAADSRRAAVARARAVRVRRAPAVRQAAHAALDRGGHPDRRRHRLLDVPAGAADQAWHVGGGGGDGGRARIWSPAASAA